jgi:hypothetical protein
MGKKEEPLFLVTPEMAPGLVRKVGLCKVGHLVNEEIARGNVPKVSKLLQPQNEAAYKVLSKDWPKDWPLEDMVKYFDENDIDVSKKDNGLPAPMSLKEAAGEGKSKRAADSK